MPLFIPTLVTTPLLKVPILLGYATCAYHGMTPTAAPPIPAERKATAMDFLLWVPRLQKAATATAKTILCGLAVCEAAALIAQESPPTSAFYSAVRDLFSRAGLNVSSLHVGFTCSSVAGCLLGIAGGLLRMSCHTSLGRFFTWEIGLREDHQLVTTGPYQYVRHPSYSGWVLLLVGHYLLLSSNGSLFVEARLWDTTLGRVAACASMAHLTWVTAGLLYRTRTEDEMLSKEFREEWDAWAKRTPYRVVPFVY